MVRGNLKSRVDHLGGRLRQWRGKLSSCRERLGERSFIEEDNVENCGIVHGFGMNVVCHNEVGPGTEVTSASFGYVGG